MKNSARLPAPDLSRGHLALGKSMVPMFIGLAAALLALALAMGQTVLAQRDARARATSERNALVALSDLMQALVDAESGQRGFLLTGDESYLAPYFAARQRSARAIATLRGVGAEASDTDADQNARRLQVLTDAKFDEVNRTVKLAQAGLHDQALAIVQADFGKIQMDAIRAEIARQSAYRERLRLEAFNRIELTEAALLPLIAVLAIAIVVLVLMGLRAERNRAAAEAEAGQAAALRDAHEQAELLTHELNHRVKNLFAVILSIVALSSRKAGPSEEVVEDIRARIRALSLAHSASQGTPGASGVAMGEVISRTMEPYADAEGQRVRIQGPYVELPVRMVTPIGLIIHELATNAVKYGALSVETGTVDITWDVTDQEPPTLALGWTEAGGPPLTGGAVGAGGFGTKMTSLAAGQLGGTMERDWPASGAVVRIRFPLP